MSAAKTPGGDAADRRPLKKVKFSPQVSVSEFLAIPASEAVTFHLLYGCSAAQLAAEIEGAEDEPAPFGCEYYNQVFGEAEEINGYKGLAVHIWIALRTGHAWVDISYEESQPGADDVQALLAEWWPRPFVTDKAEFLAAAGPAAAVDPDWPSLGTRLDLGDTRLKAAAAAGADAGSGSDGSGGLVLYHATLADTPEWFKELHARLEPLLVFTIDGANFIDTADSKWEVVAAVVNIRGRPYLAGFMTLYNFYAWPMNKRPRVAQVLVMPTLQGRGYGRALIAAAYHLAVQRDAIDLTFEDPAPSLQQLREKLEVEVMRGCDWLTAAAAAATAAAAAEEGRLQEAARQLWAAGQGGAAAAAAAGSGKNQQQGEAAAASGGGAGDNNHVAAGSSDAAAPKSPVSHLLLPPSLQQRVTRELKIHKHQVHAVWEALLYVQAAAAAAPGDNALSLLSGPITELITLRLERGAAAPADRAAARKKLVQVEGSSENFFVYKLPSRTQQQQQQQQSAQQQQRVAAAAAAAAQAAAEEDVGDEDEEDEEGDDDDGPTVSVGRHTITKVSADEHSERLQEQVSERLEALAALSRRLTARQS